MFIADRFINIREKDGFSIDDSHLVRLDEMLTEYDIKHCFCLPIAYKDGTVEDDEIVAVEYDSNDEVTVELIIALWARIELKYTADMIYRMFKKKVQKLEEKEI